MDAIRGLEYHTTVTELRSFSGLCIFSLFAPNFAGVLGMLNRKLFKGQPQTFDILCSNEMKVWETLKPKLVEPPALALSRSQGAYTKALDACDKQIECILLPEQPD